MRSLGILILICLAVALAPLGDGLRAAASAPGSWTELCINGGSVQVALARDGTPLDPAETPDSPAHRHCPDCLPTPQPAAGAQPALAVQRPVSVAHALWVARKATRSASHDTTHQMARGPPRVT